MPKVSLTNYAVAADYLLTWYPVGQTDVLATAEMRGGTFNISVEDLMPGWSNGPEIIDFLSRAPVEASLLIGVNPQKLLTAAIEVRIGRKRRSQDIVLPPDSRVPFMLHASPGQDEGVVGGTEVVFQGLFVTSPRLSLRDLLNIVKL